MFIAPPVFNPVLPQFVRLLNEHTKNQEADLYDQKITSADGFAAAQPHLTALKLSKNPLGSLRGLEGMNRLKTLFIVQTGVNDLSAIATMTSLETFNASGNNITDISALSTLNLVNLYLEGNRLELGQLRSLQTMRRLQRLWLRQGTLTNPCCSDANYDNELKRCVYCSIKNLDGAAVTDEQQQEFAGGVPLRPVLPVMPGSITDEEGRLIREQTQVIEKIMRKLTVGGQFTDVLLRNEKQGQADLYDMKITSLTGFDSVRPGLISLKLSKNPLNNLQGIEGLSSLKTLVISAATVRDLSPIRFLVQLETLNAADNAITVLAPLVGCPNLVTVYLEGNQIADAAEVKVFCCMKKLNRLWLRQGTKTNKVCENEAVYAQAVRKNVCSSIKNLDGAVLTQDMQKEFVGEDQPPLPGVPANRELPADGQLDLKTQLKKNLNSLYTILQKTK